MTLQKIYVHVHVCLHITPISTKQQKLSTGKCLFTSYDVLLIRSQLKFTCNSQSCIHFMKFLPNQSYILQMTHGFVVITLTLKTHYRTLMYTMERSQYTHILLQLF